VRRLLAVLSAAVAAVVAAVVTLLLVGGSESRPGGPSFVVIVTDDQRWDTLSALPSVRRLLAAHGVTFENAAVVNSLCCPSRASILTGQYSHSHGVYRNKGRFGGFKAFEDESTVATWLDDAGYETALVGKYLNRYGGTYVPPGWDRWVAFSGPEPGPRPSPYFGYTLNVDGELRSHGQAAGDYSTDVLAREAVSFVREASDPFFLYFVPSAPHSPATPPPRYEARFHDLPPHRPPSYDEPDVSDKPAWVRGLPPLTGGERAQLDELRRDQLRSLLAVDDAVRGIVEALEETGRLRDTFILFTSDNGQSWGEHRWRNKSTAYEEDIRVPFVVRYDRLLAAARADDRLVANIDIAPTVAALAGVEADDPDGRSLLPLLSGEEASWRDVLLVEHLQSVPRQDPVPTYCAVRTERLSYTAYVTGEEELYDLTADPFQLTNAVDDPALGDRLLELRSQVARLCRPTPPGSGADWLPR